ncbi:hypothetical protein [Lysinibacillus sphaericus]|uniref:Uncharacterized protein n=2 Tax=Lysinibacillus sphaericus TaxID=1421 RepID=A0A6H0A1K7_LYSSH|nr:hypothetical protein [Lysinibacillus sphaericus]QIS31199.1 hypothetical protein [Lysinibacillus sphaericus]QPA61253.1 hypothetical protein INQ55_23240 [Lysinibacillus sphaericus]
MNTITRANFSIEQQKSYEGYTEHNIWNGWECPLFTKEVADKIAKDFTIAGVMYINYSKEFDRYLVTYDIDEPILEWYDQITKVIDGKEVKLYPIGAFCWCWDMRE